jgi:bacteriocin leader peptide (microcyclamide/patellamide family)
MDKKNLIPQAAQPVNRITTGQLPAELAELSEEALLLHGDAQGDSVLVPSIYCGGHCTGCNCYCSYDSHDAE